MAKKSKNSKGQTVWTCSCGAGLPARYNPDNRRPCKDEDRVCAWCYKRLKAERWQKAYQQGGKNGISNST